MRTSVSILRFDQYTKRVKGFSEVPYLYRVSEKLFSFNVLVRNRRCRLESVNSLAMRTPLAGLATFGAALRSEKENLKPVTRGLFDVPRKMPPRSSTGQPAASAAPVRHRIRVDVAKSARGP